MIMRYFGNVMGKIADTLINPIDPLETIDLIRLNLASRLKATKIKGAPKGNIRWWKCTYCGKSCLGSLALRAHQPKCPMKGEALKLIALRRARLGWLKRKGKVPTSGNL